MWHAFPGLPGGRYRRYLSLREGSETGQNRSVGSVLFPSRQMIPGSVRAVKGPLPPLRALDSSRPIQGLLGVGVRLLQGI